MSSSLKDFQVLNKLGEGSFSQVYKVKRISDGLEYALKKVKLSLLSSKEKENALNEVRILASIQSPYIVSYKDAFYEEVTNCLCIIMEFAEKGDVMGKITKCQKQKIQEQDIWQALHDMTQGLKKLHDMKIMHRDLKCANVFIGKDNMNKLGDLNVSIVAKHGLVKTQTGTPYYCSPEVWSDKPYDNKCDIWSLGCIIYEMAALKPPFRANDMKGLYNKITRGQYDPIPSSYSNDLSLIISQLLKVNPKQRPTSDEILKNQIVIRRCDSSNIEQPNFPSKIELLNTIKLPSNLKQLKEKLPQQQYNLNKSFQKQNDSVKLENNSVQTPSFTRINSANHAKQPKEEPYIYKQQLIISQHKANDNNQPKNVNNKPPVRPPIPQSNRQNYQIQQNQKKDNFQYPSNVIASKVDQSPSHRYQSPSHRYQSPNQKIESNRSNRMSAEKQNVINQNLIQKKPSYEQNIFQANDNYKKSEKKNSSIDKVDQYLQNEQKSYIDRPKWWG